MFKKLLCLILDHKWKYSSPYYNSEYWRKCDRCGKNESMSDAITIMLKSYKGREEDAKIFEEFIEIEEVKWL